MSLCLEFHQHVAHRLTFGLTEPDVRLVAVVLLFEIMLVAAVVVITWFALYAVYRLVTDES